MARAYATVTEFRRPQRYADWVARVDTLSPADLNAIDEDLARLQAAGGPEFVCVVSASGQSEAELRQTLGSLEGQRYRRFRTFVVGDGDSGIELGPLDDVWVVFLRAGDAMAAHALYWFACEIVTYPNAAAVYADDDCLDGSGQRFAPRFKPAWSLEHFRATDFVGNALALRGAAVLAAGGLGPADLRHGPYALLLRIAESADDGMVKHVPAVLLHRGANSRSEGADRLAWQQATVVSHLERAGIGAEVLSSPEGLRRVRFGLRDPVPLVSIIVPTRDSAELLRTCVSSVLERTEYPRFEILLVDNRSTEVAALEFLKRIDGHADSRSSVRVLRDPRRFNYSAINNAAVQTARGSAICLLNNDTEVISPDWLSELVGRLQQPQVGVVGARLLYPDGRVQHGGDTVGPGGCANHLHHLIANNDPGYCNRAVIAQELSAVTAACLVTWRDLYLRLGGLNSRWLPVVFNDVDYCLRVREAGRKVVWTPHAELYHHESISRGREQGLRKEFRAWREVRYMRWKWRRQMLDDPFFNPNFSYFRPDFALGPEPNIRRPWHVRIGLF